MKDGIHILAVDDNKLNLKTVNAILRNKNYELTLSNNGKEAIDVLKTKKVDLVLLDIMMPEMDGFEVCETIKNIPEHKETPIIFLSSKWESENIVKGFRSGAVDYITKPFTKEELCARISNHLQIKLSKQLIKDRLDETTNSRNSMMKILLDFGKLLNTSN